MLVVAVEGFTVLLSTITSCIGLLLCESYPFLVSTFSVKLSYT